MLKKILKMSQTELFDYCIKKLKEKYTNIVIPEKKEFIAAKGDIPILLVAHLDTVFEDSNRKHISIYQDKENGVLWSPDGLGTDDRAGVAMILALIDSGYRPHILFTTDEETMATGAVAVCNKKNELFGKVSYVIELDRQGYQECVFYDCNNTDFQKLIEGYGFITKEGTFTDISVFCPNWGIAGVNLSVGYIYEHSYIEHFFVGAWKYTYKKVCEMLEDKEVYKVIWKYIPKQKIDIKE